MNWLGSSTALWTLGIAAAIAAISTAAAYVHSHRNRVVEEQHDLVREQRTRERLAQIAVPMPLSALDQPPVTDELQVADEAQTVQEPQLIEERQFAEEPLAEAPHAMADPQFLEEPHLLEERQTA